MSTYDTKKTNLYSIDLEQELKGVLTSQVQLVVNEDYVSKPTEETKEVVADLIDFKDVVVIKPPAFNQFIALDRDPFYFAHAKLSQ